MNADREVPGPIAAGPVAQVLEAIAARLSVPADDDLPPLDAPELDAKWLVAHVTALDPATLAAMSATARTVTAEEAARLEALVEERRRGVPIAHLLGEWEFWSLPLFVTPDVLVPRPETELLVEWGSALLVDHPAPRIADLGTGSGCLAIALALELPRATVVAVEISPEALAVAERNIARHELGTRVTTRLGDLAAPLRDEAPFDLIVSNPPYIAIDDPRLARDVARYEPSLALFDRTDSGDAANGNGLGFYRRLIAECPARLAPDGGLLVELPEDGAGAVAAMVEEAGGRSEVRTDLSGIERALLARVFRPLG